MGKPATIIGAEGRAGTARAQMQLLETLGETGSIVMVNPGLQVFAFAPETFDSDGNLIDEQIKELLRRHMDEFAKWITQLVQPREFVAYACEMDAAPAQV